MSILEDSKGGTVTAAALTFQPAGRLQVALLPRIKLLIHTSPLHSIGSGGRLISRWGPGPQGSLEASELAAATPTQLTFGRQSGLLSCGGTTSA